MKWFVVLAGVVSAMLVAVPASAILIQSASTTQGVISITGGGTELVYEAHIVADPNGDPIMKVIETDGSGGTIPLTELLTIDPGPSLADWHEQLMVFTALGGWVESPDDDGLYWEWVSVVDPVLPITVSNTGDLASMVWGDPLPPGTSIHIEKGIVVPAGMQTFAIMEWPTVIPEPATLSLVAAGAVLALLRRRKT